MNAPTGLKILVPSALAPMVEDGEINQTNVAAIVLRNAGTATVELFYGMYQLDSKETITFNVTELYASLDLKIPVKFDTSTGAAKELQIVLLKASNC